MNRIWRIQRVGIVLALILIPAFAAASPQEELPGRTYVQGVDESMDSITLTGAVRMLGDARTASPALILDEDGIEQTGGVSTLGLIGPGARQLLEDSQGSVVSVEGRLLSKADYEAEYSQLYPLRYGPFGGYLFIPGENNGPDNGEGQEQNEGSGQPESENTDTENSDTENGNGE